MTSLSHGTADWLSPVSVANELAAQHSNIWLVLAVAVFSVLQKPSTFPSSTCIGLLWGDHVCYGGYSCYMCSSSISYMLTAACWGCIDSSKSWYLLCRSSSRSIPPRPNTLTLSCTLPRQSPRELSWQKYIYIL